MPQHQVTVAPEAVVSIPGLTSVSQVMCKRSSMPLTPLGMALKSWMPALFWLEFQGQWSVAMMSSTPPATAAFRPSWCSAFLMGGLITYFAATCLQSQPLDGDGWMDPGVTPLFASDCFAWRRIVLAYLWNYLYLPRKSSIARTPAAQATPSARTTLNGSVRQLILSFLDCKHWTWNQRSRPRSRGPKSCPPQRQCQRQWSLLSPFGL